MAQTEKLTLDRRVIDHIIRASQVCRLGLAIDGEPYLVPVSFGYDGQALFFHTSKNGRKIEFFERNPRVCLEFENAVRLLRDNPDPCRWSFAYETVIGYGRVSELTELSEMESGLRHVVRHYAGEEVPFLVDKSLNARVWRVTIESLCGKRNRLPPV